MKKLNEYINENIDSSSIMYTLISVLFLLNSVILIIGSQYNSDLDDTINSFFDKFNIKKQFNKWKRNKKINEICLRLSKDPEIIEMTKSKKNGWRKLLESKLSDDEKQYIKSITRKSCIDVKPSILSNIKNWFSDKFK